MAYTYMFRLFYSLWYIFYNCNLLHIYVINTIFIINQICKIMFKVKVSTVDGKDVSLIYFKELPSCLFPFIDYSKYSIEIKKVPNYIQDGKI